MNLVNPYLFAPAGNTDPYFSSVVLLLHADGTNGATSTTDSSSVGNSITFGGNAQLSTTSPKFGTASLMFDGSGDYVQAPDSTNWDFGTGDFTVEFWYNSTVNTTDPGTFISQYDGNGFTFRWYLGALYFLNGGSTIATGGSWTPTTGVWYHIAACRSGTSLRLFVDGTQSGSTATDSSNITGSSVPLELGCLPYSGSHVHPLNGKMDDIRITKGVARYTANFTAPTAAFPNS